MDKNFLLRILVPQQSPEGDCCGSQAGAETTAEQKLFLSSPDLIGGSRGKP